MEVMINFGRLLLKDPLKIKRHIRVRLFKSLKNIELKLEESKHKSRLNSENHPSKNSRDVSIDKSKCESSH